MMGKVWRFKEIRRRLWLQEMDGQVKGCLRWKPDGITDNREKWAKEVLSQEVPAHEIDMAMDILFAPYPRISWAPLSLITPREIAKNWNKDRQLYCHVSDLDNVNVKAIQL